MGGGIRAVTLGIVALCSACAFDPVADVTKDADVSVVDDGGDRRDAGMLDSGESDSGLHDGGLQRDGGPRDGGRDAGAPDAADHDAGEQDAGDHDSGPRDSGPRDGGPRDSGPRDSGPRDGGPPPYDAGFPYLSNFGQNRVPAPAPGAWVVSGAPCLINTAARSSGGSCPGLTFSNLALPTGDDAAVLSVESAVINDDIMVIGDDALIIVAETIFELRPGYEIRVSANGPTPGPGANGGSGATPLCSPAATPTDAGGGGGGGGYATVGGNGAGPTISPTAMYAGGGPMPPVSFEPLRGGCDGTAGIPVDLSDPRFPGGGGGALQISAGVRITLDGIVRADGGGGEGGLLLANDGTNNFPQGGSGGGSGGLLLIEAPRIDARNLSVFSAAGGGGGQGGRGASPTRDGDDGEDGDQASQLGTPGGADGSSGGSGGNGAVAVTTPIPFNGGSGPPGSGSGGGGGGGAAGRIYLRTNRCDFTGNPTFYGEVISSPASMNCP